jgi:hypothetical protein
MDYTWIAEEFITRAQLKNETWRAFAEGGELAWIDDPELLDSISHAYFAVRRAMTLWDRLFQLRYIATESPTTNTRASIGKTLDGSLRETQARIKETIQVIQTALEKDVGPDEPESGA